MPKTLTRRNLLRGAGGLAPALARGAAKRPNFLFVLTDDQRFDALGCAGNKIIRTPAMDAVAARGIRFSNAFVTTSVCSASRATILTGRYGSVNGVPGLGGGLRAGEGTFVPHLKKVGYRTGFVGKWHLEPPSPEEAGFESSTWFVSNGPHYDRKVTEAGKQRVAPGFIEEYLADRAIAFLDDAARGPAPFFLHLCTQLPHMNPQFDWQPRPETLRLYDGAPLRVPANWRDDLRGKPPYLGEGRHRQQAHSYGYGEEAGVLKHIARYYAAITDLDRALGRVFAALDRLGVRDNTYVVLLGDNGWMIGEHGFTSKVLPYEESIRVPLAIAGPGLRAGVRGEMVLNADMAPTLLELAGIEAPANMHGRSMRGLLEGRKTSWRTSMLYEAIEPTLGSWPLVAIRDERWKYVRTFDVKDRARVVFEELYDLKGDPGELRNLASSAEHAVTRRRLEAELEKLRSSIAT
jgi:arylsulfatase A-like enzyme